MTNQEQMVAAAIRSNELRKLDKRVVEQLGGKFDRLSPHYSSDLDAAITLVPEGDKDHRFWLRRLSATWRAIIEDYSLIPSEHFFDESGDTPAEAIVRAWLDWKGQRG